MTHANRDGGSDPQKTAEGMQSEKEGRGNGNIQCRRVVGGRCSTPSQITQKVLGRRGDVERRPIRKMVPGRVRRFLLGSIITPPPMSFLEGWTRGGLGEYRGARGRGTSVWLDEA